MAVQGVKELKAQLQGIKRAVRNASRAAAYAGAVEIRQALRTAAPTRKATARRSIAAKRKQSPQQGTGLAQVGMQGPAFYLMILSTGAQGHIITAGSVSKIVDPRTRRIIEKRPKKKLVLGVSERPGKVTKGKFQPLAVWHPGLRGRNWIHPVIESAHPRAVEAMGERYSEAMSQFASK